ncbi:MAG: hypothetical protein PHC53_03485 [Patescibacteria group bacterium]|nr:hypothetical protein [Patescibacteria group bacterium]
MIGEGTFQPAQETGAEPEDKMIALLRKYNEKVLEIDQLKVTRNAIDARLWEINDRYGDEEYVKLQNQENELDDQIRKAREEANGLRKEAFKK